MEANIKLGIFWGIPIGLHTSWFFIFGLITWSLATGYFPEAYPDLLMPVHWALGGVTSVLFFASVLVHELGHSYLALRNNIPVRGITLFVFGRLAQIEREPESPGAEFRIAIAGPVVSLTLAALFGGLWLLERETVWLAAPSMWLARINLMLALFNMIPGFPLDGAESSALSSGDPAMILDRQPATPPALSSLQPKFFVMKIPRPLWRVTAVNKVMVPWEKLAVVHSQSSLAQAVQGCTDHG